LLPAILQPRLYQVIWTRMVIWPPSESFTPGAFRGVVRVHAGTGRWYPGGRAIHCFTW